MLLAIWFGTHSPNPNCSSAGSDRAAGRWWFARVDLKVGGGFRFVLRGPDGRDMGMRGVYREIVPPDRSVHMESFDDYPGESQVTSVFVEHDGKDNANRHGTLPVAGGSRPGYPIRHGARRRGELRQAGGDVGRSKHETGRSEAMNSINALAAGCGRHDGGWRFSPWAGEPCDQSGGKAEKKRAAMPR